MNIQFSFSPYIISFIKASIPSAFIHLLGYTLKISLTKLKIIIYICYFCIKKTDSLQLMQKTVK